jgi:small-conductance mechanosensitive channel
MNTRICGLLLLLITTGASAEGMEERLRTQLRSTTQQLQALQSEQAQASAARIAAETQAKQAQAQIKQLTAEQVGKFKKAYEDLLVIARGKETERARLQAQLTERDTQVQQCSVKNQQMYGVAQQLLTAYEKIDVADVMSIRQPFASSTRVKFEELAQGFGDGLYLNRFDAPQTVTNH